MSVPSALSEMERTTTKGIRLSHATWAMAAPSISQQLAEKTSRREALASGLQMNWSPDETRPSTQWMPAERMTLTAFCTSKGSASKKRLRSDVIVPGSYPRAWTSKSYWTVSRETTMSPTSSEGSMAPATPVLITWVTPKTQASVCMHMAALTLPTPDRTTTTGTPEM